MSPYKPTIGPYAHRPGVTAADASDAFANNVAIDMQSRDTLHIDVKVASGSVTSATFQALFKNTRTNTWHGGDKITLTGADLPATFTIDGQARSVAIKVTALSGTTPNLDLDYTLT